jgi:hypothetical protein
MSAIENFPILLSDAEEESSAVPPCFSSEGINVLPPRGVLKAARLTVHTVPVYPT